MTEAGDTPPDYGAEYWPNSGYGLLEVDSDGRLAVTDDFLRAYLLRPEVRPIAESCDAERFLHAALMDDPRRRVEPAFVTAIADPDAAENYGVLVAFFRHLIDAGTVEAAYLAAVRADPVTVPSLFLDQLAHVTIRRLLGAAASDGLAARAGELWFRPQIAHVDGGTVLLADRERVESYSDHGRAKVDLDILTEAAAADYWARAELHDTVFDLGFARPGLDRFARLAEAWIGHFLGVSVAIQPMQSIRDERWVWHTGLDVESSRIMNAMYRGEPVGDEDLARILALFRLDFADPTAMLPAVAGRPVYLGLAMTENRIVRFKPQNLLVNLPLALPA